MQSPATTIEFATKQRKLKDKHSTFNLVCQAFYQQKKLLLNINEFFLVCTNQKYLRTKMVLRFLFHV